MDINLDDGDWGYDDYDYIVSGTVIPEFELERDNAKQIADSMLMAIMDGKEVYGAFEPACCETTVKVKNNPNIPSKSRLTYMSINFSAEHAEWDPEISDLPYEHWATTSNLFSGTETTENMFVPFKAEDIGGVYNKMIYTAGELKSMDMMSGGAGESIEDLISDLYDIDDVNLDAVMPITSENYRGRALAAATKSHHEIYGVQTDLARIKVNFDNYSKETFPYESAVDWSRILVSLKYNGVANLLYDKQRREILSQIDYVMHAAPPINSWPILPKSSFILPKFRVPRELAAKEMQRFFDQALTIFSSVDIYQMIIDRLDSVKEFSLKYADMASDIYNAAMRILVNKIETVKRASAFRVTGYNELVSGNLYLRSEADIKKSYNENKGISPANIFTDVTRDKIAKLVNKDPSFAKGLFDYYEKVHNQAPWNLTFTVSELEEISHMFKLVTTEPYVHKMIALWNAIQPDYEKAVITMTKYLSRFVQAPINIGIDWPMSAGKRFVLNQPIVVIKTFMRCRDAPLTDLSKIKLVLASNDPKRQVVSTFEQTRRYISKIAEAWADRYSMQYERFKDKDPGNENTIKYQILSVAFKEVTYILLMDTNQTYVLNGSNPILAKIFNNYCRKRSYKCNRVHDAIDIIDYGEKLDEALPEEAKLRFADSAQLIKSRFDMVHQDVKEFLESSDKEPRDVPEDFDKIYAEAFIKKEEPKKNEPFDLKAYMASLGISSIKRYDPVTDHSRRNYKAEAKATFEDEEEAETYAKTLGYVDYEDWYTKEGRQAKKSMEVEDEYFRIIVERNLARMAAELDDEGEETYDLTN